MQSVFDHVLDRLTGWSSDDDDSDDTARVSTRPATDHDAITASTDTDDTMSTSSITTSDTTGDSTDSTTSDTGDEWTAPESPTSKTLHDVTHTDRGPYACGVSGMVLTRTDGAWTAVVEDGPATRQNALKSIAATDDGERVWFAGSSGSLGALDVSTGRKHDYSAPKEKTSTWEAIAVTGPKGDERIKVANGSGEVLSVTTDENGCPVFGDVVKPGSGSTIPALGFGGGNWYAVDTSGNAFRTDDEGNWTDIGVRNAQVNFFDVHATEDRLLIAGGDGRIYRYDDVCKNWTPVIAGEGALQSIDGDGSTIAVAGAAGGVFRRGTGGWQEESTPVADDLFGLSLGPSDVAVGASGTIIER
ncbi:WD40/YVTN/BNR-like repeat-containing protein [Haloarchaeobius amylolyticus]|uniref:WD40/YVTN/BNR-like repeat-containing protein n=1 Tax=Haloarchaeobius amylolyticus TaxID=1198296 RepID=UPI00226F506C|nr:hypothetical protein [Haloarchaeobius amylolyticus]